MSVRITTDSTCDLPLDVVKRLGIVVLPLYIHVGDQHFLDGIDITREDFYANLPNYKSHPSTAVPSPTKFVSIYNTLADEGADEIISIHISSSLSAISDVAKVAASEVNSTKVTVLDSGQLSLGTGFLVKKAAELAQEGQSASQIIEVLKKQMPRTFVAASLDTLQFLRRSGRMSRAVSTIGELMHIKPILKMNNGISSVERLRTKQKSIARLAELLRLHGPFEQLAFLHSGAVESMAALKESVRDFLPSGEIMQEMINPVLGSHIGPGVIGFACVTNLDQR